MLKQAKEIAAQITAWRRDFHQHHTPLFDIDESTFPEGAAILAETTVRLLRHFSK